MKPFSGWGIRLLVISLLVIYAHAQTAPPPQPPSLGEIARQQREAKAAKEAAAAAADDKSKTVRTTSSIVDASGVKRNCTTIKTAVSTSTVCVNAPRELEPRDVTGLTRCADLKCLAGAAASRTPAYLERDATGTVVTLRNTSKYHWELKKFTADQVEMYLSVQPLASNFDPEGGRRMQFTEEQIAKAVESDKDSINTLDDAREGTCVYPLSAVKELLASVGAKPPEGPKLSAEQRLMAEMMSTHGVSPEDTFLMSLVGTLGFAGGCNGSLFGK
jgi:hypothetical protein